MKLLQIRPVEGHEAAYPQTNEEALSLLRTGRYPRCRIPGIVALPDGEMLAYFECRMSDSDWAPIDLAMRRISPDGTVGPRERLVSGKGRLTLNNPVMIPDGDVLHFLYCEGYKRLFYCRSDDGGRSWTPPTELTDAADADFFWSVLAAGPGHGIRTVGGRLVVPMWFGTNRLDAHAHHPSVIAAIFSDDGGRAWQLGNVFSDPALFDPSECCVAQLPDGRLLLNIRNENPDACRRTAVSADGGRTWTDLRAAPSLPDPTCSAGLCRAGENLLFTNCADPVRRGNLTVKLLDAAGDTLDAVRISEEGGYSDVCLNPKTKTAFVLYEAGSDLRLAEIAL